MVITCVCASNILHSGEDSVSQRLCDIAANHLTQAGAVCEMVGLRDYDLSPCTGCGGCFYTLRCCRDNAFNALYERLVRSDGLLFVSPHYAPIPARLCMLLEKMEEIAFLHWWKDSGYRAETWGIPAGIVSHGGGAGWALKSYKAMVNDTIANALVTIQCQVVPYHSPWDTGLALPVSRVEEGAGIFPLQRYDWEGITLQLAAYADMLLQAARAGRSK